MEEQAVSLTIPDLGPLASFEFLTLKMAALLFLLGALVSLLFWFTRSKEVGYGSVVVTLIASIMLTVSLALRYFDVGHLPYVQMYETYLFTAWAIAAIAVIADFWVSTRLPSTIANILAGLILVYVWTWPMGSREGQPLSAALQSPWLDVHIATAFLAYAGFAISAGAGIVYLFNRNDKVDELSYKLIAFSFPLLGMGILLGAVWANVAWGRYWGWDPKETAALVTWLVYAGYLHARLAHGWKGVRASILNIVGFLCVVFTWIGLNIVARLVDLHTLHAYS